MGPAERITEGCLHDVRSGRWVEGWGSHLEEVGQGQNQRQLPSLPKQARLSDTSLRPRKWRPARGDVVTPGAQPLWGCCGGRLATSSADPVPKEAARCRAPRRAARPECLAQGSGAAPPRLLALLGAFVPSAQLSEWPWTQQLPGEGSGEDRNWESWETREEGMNLRMGKVLRQEIGGVGSRVGSYPFFPHETDKKRTTQLHQRHVTSPRQNPNMNQTKNHQKLWDDRTPRVGRETKINMGTGGRGSAGGAGGGPASLMREWMERPPRLAPAHPAAAAKCLWAQRAAPAAPRAAGSGRSSRLRRGGCGGGGDRADRAGTGAPEAPGAGSGGAAALGPGRVAAARPGGAAHLRRGAGRGAGGAVRAAAPGSWPRSAVRAKQWFAAPLHLRPWPGEPSGARTPPPGSRPASQPRRCIPPASPPGPRRATALARSPPSPRLASPGGAAAGSGSPSSSSASSPPAPPPGPLVAPLAACGSRSPGPGLAPAAAAPAARSRGPQPGPRDPGPTPPPAQNVGADAIADGEWAGHGERE